MSAHPQPAAARRRRYQGGDPRRPGRTDLRRVLDQDACGARIDRAALIASLQAQNAVSPAGALQSGDEKLALRVTGAFESEQDVLDVNIASNGRLIRLRDIADVRRGYVDPPQPMLRVNGKEAIGIAIAMRDGGDILARRAQYPEND